jgi:tRNA A-37 threonylcarbamoyl transferase component Bud32
MNREALAAMGRLPDPPPVIDIGAGHPEAPANAIPNLIAELVETETWRNAATVIMGLLLAGLGYWAYQGVRTSLAAARTTSLTALSGAVVAGIEVWVADHRNEATRLARDPATAERVARLAADASTPAGIATGCVGDDAERLVRSLREDSSSLRQQAPRIVDRNGTVIAAGDKASCGQRIRHPLFRQRLDLAFDGKPQFVRPVPDPLLSLESPGGAPRRPLAWILAPVRASTGAVVAVLAVGVVTDREFGRIFAAAQGGEAMEVFAFAEDGALLTPAYKAARLAAADPASTPPGDVPFSVFARDPGGNLAEGHRPKFEASARPLIEPAALAIAARVPAHASERVGILTTPYRSYTGEDAIGVWRWLPEFDLGVIAEMSAAEAFAPMRYLLVSFSVIGGLLVLTLAAAMLSSLLLFRLKRQFTRLQRLGAYTLEKQISEGGMATIYLARHALLKRPTAVKVLKRHVATDEFIHRFEREVQLASQLMHPNTVEIYDFGRTLEGQPYYVMEYLDGVTLAELVADSGPVPPGRAVHILRQVAAALREAHSRGLVHRDVKPENVMLCRRGEDDVVKLLDFGLVKNLEHQHTRDITKQIRILGTPRYMAPERLVNPSDVDARSDIYALGAVGFFLLTGKSLFDGDDNLAISNQVLHAAAPSVRDQGVPDIPAAFEALIAACLEKDRARRPQTADAVIAALDRIASRSSWTQDDAARWWGAYRGRRTQPRGSAPAPGSADEKAVSDTEG